MDILGRETREATRAKLRAELEGEVRLIHFTRRPAPAGPPGAPTDDACAFLAETRSLLEEVAALSPKLRLEIHDVDEDAAAAASWGIDKVPGLAVSGAADDGIRFFGFPTGFEYTSLIEAIVDVSTRRTSLSEPVRSALRAIDRPVHIQVFVTPTCSLCPVAVRTAHRFALESPFVRADMVEANEFPGLSDRYAVLAVPKTIVNGTVAFEGPLAEDLFLERVLEGLGASG